MIFGRKYESNNGSKKELNLVELHEMKEIFSWKPISVYDEQKGHQYIDGKVYVSTSLFSKYCNRPIASYVHGSFEEDFGMPIYDEYEDDDHSFAKTCTIKEVPILENLGEDCGISFENFYKYSMHGSFGNQSSYG